jgi:hypothetical protein
MADNDDALLSESTAFEDRRYDAMVRGDSAGLAAVFDEGLIYTHSSGVRQDAAEYLRGLTLTFSGRSSMASTGPSGSWIACWSTVGSG